MSHSFSQFIASREGEVLQWAYFNKLHYSKDHKVSRKYLLSISDLHRLSELQEMPLDLDPYVKKLMNSRRRIMLVNNILQNAQVL